MFRTGLCLLMLCIVQQVSAHASPLSTDPAVSSINAVIPSMVQIRFSERIDATASSIRVYAPDGSLVDDGKSVVDATDPRLFKTAINASSSGTYTVSWQVVSQDDGHFTKGGFLFSVGTETAATVINSEDLAVQHRSGWPLAIMIWLELLGSAVVIGLLSLIVTVWRPLNPNLHLDLKRLRILIVGAMILLIAGCLGFLVINSMNLAADRGTDLVTALQTFLLTVVGRFTVHRMILGIAACLLLLWALPSMLRSKKITETEWILWALMIAIVILRARISHAAASEFLPTFSIGINAVHLLFKDLWIGGLIVFCLAAPRTVHSLFRLSQLLMLSLAIGGTTGMYIVWLHLKDPLNLFTTHWGGHAIALGSFGLLLLTLRLYQQHITHRALLQMAEGTATDGHKEEAVMHPAVLLSETLTGLAVLLFSSMLIITTPPLPRPNVYTTTMTTNNAVVTLREHPTDASQFLVTVRRTERGGDTANQTLSILLNLPEKNIGPVAAEVLKISDDVFTFPKAALSPPGEWTIDITEQEPQVFDVNARFELLYPDDVAASRDNAHHVFGMFEAVLFLTALVLIAIAVVELQHQKRLFRRIEKLEVLLPIASRQSLLFIILIDLCILAMIGFLLGSHSHSMPTYLV